MTARKFEPKRRGDPAKYREAQNYLRALPFNEWIKFEDIPEHIFDEVFDLLDENYIWDFWTDDFDTEFKKRLKGEQD